MSANGRDGFNVWLQEPPGQLLLELETQLVNRALANLFGYHILQIGRLADVDLLDQSRVLHKAIIEVDGDRQHAVRHQSSIDVPPGGRHPGTGHPIAAGHPISTGHPTARARATELPIESDSVDVVVMPHLLEFEANPHEALREGMRVLLPEGHIVISGFNPWSFFGLWRQFRRRSNQGPWTGRFLGLDRIKDWLALLGFDLLQVEGCYARPPFSREGLLRRFNRPPPRLLGRKALLSGAYVLVGRKRVTRLTPIRTPWRPRRRLAEAGLAGPTARDGAMRRTSISTGGAPPPQRAISK